MASLFECVAARRFIPPKGAMQFEVTLMRRPETKPLEGRAVWVQLPPKGGDRLGERFCQCENEYRLLLDSVPVRSSRKFLAEVVAQGAILMVCECNGRIIE